MTKKMFMLVNLPENARVKISECAAGDGGVCAFFLGVVAGTKAAADYFSAPVGGLLHSDSIADLCQNCDRYFIQDAISEGSNCIAT